MTIPRKRFFPSAMCFLRIEFSSSGLTASAFTHCITLLGLSLALPVRFSETSFIWFPVLRPTLCQEVGTKHSSLELSTRKNVSGPGPSLPLLELGFSP